MAGEVLAELRALLGFGFELQLDEFFNRLWASIRSVVAWIYIEYVVQACLVDGGAFRKTRLGFFRNFRKKGSSGSNETSSESTGLPKSSRNTSSGKFPEEVVLPGTFRKKGSSI